MQYLYLYVDGLEGVSLKCPHPHQNVVSVVETSFPIFIQSILEAIHCWGVLGPPPRSGGKVLSYI